jgi:hypothetical protein
VSQPYGPSRPVTEIGLPFTCRALASQRSKSSSELVNIKIRDVKINFCHSSRSATSETVQYIFHVLEKIIQQQKSTPLIKIDVFV